MQICLGLFMISSCLRRHENGDEPKFGCNEIRYQQAHCMLASQNSILYNYCIYFCAHVAKRDRILYIYVVQYLKHSREFHVNRTLYFVYSAIRTKVERERDNNSVAPMAALRHQPHLIYCKDCITISLCTSTT